MVLEFAVSMFLCTLVAALALARASARLIAYLALVPVALVAANLVLEKARWTGLPSGLSQAVGLGAMTLFYLAVHRHPDVEPSPQTFLFRQLKRYTPQIFLGLGGIALVVFLPVDNWAEDLASYTFVYPLFWLLLGVCLLLDRRRNAA